MTKRIRFAGYQPERSVHTRAARALGAAVDAAFSVEITAQITSTGRAAADLLAMTECGDIDMCYFASSYLAGRVPELGLLDLPFAGANRDAIWRRLDGDAGRLLAESMARRTDLRLLAFWDNGVRHISNGVRPIRHPRDCAGLSIRTLDNAFHQAVFAAMGFKPRFIDVKDLGRAVVAREIDAQENPLTNLVNFDLHKVHRFVSLTGHFCGIALLLANRGFVEGLGGSGTSVIDEAVRAATLRQRELAAAEDETCLEALMRDGVVIERAAEIDVAAFREAVGPVVAREQAKLPAAILRAWA